MQKAVDQSESKHRIFNIGNSSPVELMEYINELEKFIETKVSSISTSPERNDTILIEDPFKN